MPDSQCTSMQRHGPSSPQPHAQSQPPIPTTPPQTHRQLPPPPNINPNRPRARPSDGLQPKRRMPSLPTTRMNKQLSLGKRAKTCTMHAEPSMPTTPQQTHWQLTPPQNPSPMQAGACPSDGLQPKRRMPSPPTTRMDMQLSVKRAKRCTMHVGSHPALPSQATPIRISSTISTAQHHAFEDASHSRVSMLLEETQIGARPFTHHCMHVCW